MRKKGPFLHIFKLFSKFYLFDISIISNLRKPVFQDQHLKLFIFRSNETDRK